MQRNFHKKEYNTLKAAIHSMQKHIKHYIVLV